MPARERVKTVVHITHPSFNGDMLLSAVDKLELNILKSYSRKYVHLRGIVPQIGSWNTTVRKHREVIPNS